MDNSSHFPTSPPLHDNDVWMRAGKEMTAATASVVAYHPVKTVVTDMIRANSTAHTTVWSLSRLYSGFFPGLLGAHQLFAMSAAFTILKERYLDSQAAPAENVAAAALSGAVTAVTVTPCEAATIFRQENKPGPHSFTQHYRGMTPMLVRQAGLGVGIFALPSLMMSWMQDKEEPSKVTEVACSLMAGLTSSAATQPFENARVFMQKDWTGQRYPSIASAMQESARFMTSPQGLKVMGGRMLVLGVASGVFNFVHSTLCGGKK
jgi:hypothetical protein